MPRLALLLVLGLLVFPNTLSAAQVSQDEPRVLEASERATLVEAYNRWAAGLRSLRASGKAHVGAEGEKTRAFDFSMVLSRPGNTRLQGRWGSLASLFDLSGDGSGWTLYLPREQSVVRADDGAPSAGLLLPPVEIVAVLLPAGIPPTDLERSGAASLEGGLARLVLPPGTGRAGSRSHRVMFLDPKQGIPRRLEIRQSSQLETPILVAEYEQYEGRGAEAFPVKVKVTLREGGQWASFNFATIRINDEVPDHMFRIKIPTGTRELAPDQLTPDFLPVEDTP